MEAILSFFGNCAALFGDLIGWLVDVIGHLGYAGIVGLMFLESSFFPFPQRGRNAARGLSCVEGRDERRARSGSRHTRQHFGALFNYWIAVRWGRPFFEKYGKYFFVTHESLDKAEVFFAHHGHISTFTGRLLPVIRQYISLPAGLARMPLPQFCFYTALGSGVWVTILTLLGYFLGSNEALIHEELHKITILLIAGCAVLVVIYAIAYKRKKRGRK